MRIRRIAPPAVVFRLDNSERDIQATLGPALGDDGAAQGGLEVNAQIALAGVADVALAPAGCERRILDMGGEDKVGRECGRPREGLGAMHGAGQLQSGRGRDQRFGVGAGSRERGRRFEFKV